MAITQKEQAILDQEGLILSTLSYIVSNKLGDPSNIPALQTIRLMLDELNNVGASQVAKSYEPVVQRIGQLNVEAYARSIKRKQ